MIEREAIGERGNGQGNELGMNRGRAAEKSEKKCLTYSHIRI